MNKEDWLDWKENEEVRERLASRFASAEWFDTVGEELMKESDDEEVFGDFEDLEADPDSNPAADDNDGSFSFSKTIFFIFSSSLFFMSSTC